MIEVLHWVGERFERNGHSVEVGEALRVFPVAPRDTIALAHTLAERSWMFPGCVVSTKRLPLSDLADSLAADLTTPSESRSMEVAVADARDIPKLSQPMMATGAWLRSSSSSAQKTTLGGWVAVG